jgi:hypothetical protein
MDTSTIFQIIYDQVDAYDWLSPAQKRAFFRRMALDWPHHSAPISEREIDAFLATHPFP